MGKWAARLASHLAEEKSSHPPTEALTKPTKGASVSFGSDPIGVREEISLAANDPAPAEPRPYRGLTKAEGDAAHAEPWDDAACARFVARVGLFLRRGINATDADDLAERLHLRDVQGDDRAVCVECAHLSGRPGARICGNHRAAGVGRELPEAMLMQAARCAGFRAG